MLPGLSVKVTEPDEFCVVAVIVPFDPPKQLTPVGLPLTVKEQAVELTVTDAVAVQLFASVTVTT